MVTIVLLSGHLLQVWKSLKIICFFPECVCVCVCDCMCVCVCVCVCVCDCVCVCVCTGGGRGGGVRGMVRVG